MNTTTCDIISLWSQIMCHILYTYYWNCEHILEFVTVSFHGICDYEFYYEIEGYQNYALNWLLGIFYSWMQVTINTFMREEHKLYAAWWYPWFRFEMLYFMVCKNHWFLDFCIVCAPISIKHDWWKVWHNTWHTENMTNIWLNN